mgnify:CR=1 FL=1|jgi:SEC-C motif-containing protein
MPQTVSPICPCGQTGARGKPLLLAECCGRYLDAGQDAPDALALMRSRYSAFVLARLDYLRATWHPDTCPVDPAPVDGTKWLGLQVRGHRVLDATHAEVEFVARYRVAGRAVRLHERSRFVNEQGRWLYVDGDLL